jgi:hypothetical protein
MTLDDIARSPGQAGALRPEEARALLAQCVIVQSALLAPVLAAVPAAPAGAPTASSEEWLTLEDAAKLIGVSTRWFTRRRGRLAFVKKLSPKKVMVDKAGLLRWVGAQRA